MRLDMKKVALMAVLGIVFIGCGEKKIYSEQDIYLKESVWYEKATDEKADGIYKEFTSNNTLKEELPLEDGVPDGIVKTYYPSGKIDSEIPYIDGKKEGIAKGYYESGALRYETPYKDDEREGEKKSFYESGAVSSVVVFVAGKKYGSQKRYEENGKLSDEIPYENGLRHGVRKSYDNDVLRYEVTYENGKKVSGIIYGTDGSTRNMREIDYIQIYGFETEQ